MHLTLGNLSITIKSGALIPVLLMLPNVLWMLLPEVAGDRRASGPLFLTIAENGGRIAILLLPFFYSLDLNRKFSTLTLIGMGLALAIYYTSWVRYLAGGRAPELFRAPLLGIPLPLATAPVLFVVLASYLMGSWLMFGASILFGVAHIWVSALTL